MFWSQQAWVKATARAYTGLKAMQKKHMGALWCTSGISICTSAIAIGASGNVGTAPPALTSATVYTGLKAMHKIHIGALWCASGIIIHASAITIGASGDIGIGASGIDIDIDLSIGTSGPWIEMYTIALDIESKCGMPPVPAPPASSPPILAPPASSPDTGASGIVTFGIITSVISTQWGHECEVYIDSMGISWHVTASSYTLASGICTNWMAITQIQYSFIYSR
ncbi:hypothetical protein GGX14DRAFT_402604 [Mycena pura]|uniref:Uncharacterized protein n=1 Tax=Mycena pura TaxID=153505 RepID=A0AAD6UXD7_9AGAR|nr:hypothetical protein GGX14DRAFT_402604 [Mycena pura]